MLNAVFLISEVDGDQTTLQKLAARWGLINDDQANLALVITPDRLELRKLDEPKLGAIYVDFLSKVMKHRRRYGGGRNEAIAKAVGIKGQYLPDVVDATAGLGRDAFVLACLGCKVRMFERNPVVAALLADGLQRAYADTEFGPWLRKRLILHYGSSLTAMALLMPPPDVVYLDPMFPHRKKSALVKKEMRIFQTLVGYDDDAENLLAPALAIALHRVVVKRQNFTQPLAGVTAQADIKTKNHRFDLYKPHYQR